MRHLLTLPILLYRRLISPLTPPSCRFRPTCSEYAVTALRRHGALKGLRLALWRLLRCHPFTEADHDPVPPARGKRIPSTKGPFALLLRSERPFHPIWNRSFHRR